MNSKELQGTFQLLGAVLDTNSSPFCFSSFFRLKSSQHDNELRKVDFEELNVESPRLGKFLCNFHSPLIQPYVACFVIIEAGVFKHNQPLTLKKIFINPKG